jgi:phosphatidylserine/phosphatidylglycerophosphate/cardiolipin synthase-like enzyme
MQTAKAANGMFIFLPEVDEEAIVQTIGEAKDTVFVQAYTFTSDPIAHALVDAKKRGVVVSVILDESQQSEPNGKANFLSHADIRTLIDGAHSAHNKVMIIDDETVVAGSFNFTLAAEEKTPKIF